jgi:hypothetical protein
MPGAWKTGITVISHLFRKRLLMQYMQKAEPWVW